MIGGTEVTVRDIELVEREIKIKNGRRCVRKNTFKVSETEPKSIDALQQDGCCYDSFMEYTLNKYGRQPGEEFHEESSVGGQEQKDEKAQEEDVVSPTTIDLDLGDDVIEVEVTEEEDEESSGDEASPKNKEDKKYEGGTPTASMKKVHHRAVSRIYTDVLRPHSSFRRVGSILKTSGVSSVGLLECLAVRARRGLAADVKREHVAGENTRSTAMGVSTCRCRVT